MHVPCADIGVAAAGSQKRHRASTADPFYRPFQFTATIAASVAPRITKTVSCNPAYEKLARAHDNRIAVTPDGVSSKSLGIYFIPLPHRKRWERGNTWTCVSSLWQSPVCRCVFLNSYQSQSGVEKRNYCLSLWFF